MALKTEAVDILHFTVYFLKSLEVCELASRFRRHFPMSVFVRLENGLLAVSISICISVVPFSLISFGNQIISLS